MRRARGRLRRNGDCHGHDHDQQHPQQKQYPGQSYFVHRVFYIFYSRQGRGGRLLAPGRASSPPCVTQCGLSTSMMSRRVSQTVGDEL